MKRLISYNLAALIIFTLVSTAAYYLLLQDNCLNMSISAIIKQSHSLNLNQHLVVLGILPVYIALVIFGAASLGLYLNTVLQQFLFKIFQKTHPSSPHQNQAVGNLPYFL